MTIEGRKAKIKVITLANQSKRNQLQSVHGDNNCEQVTNVSAWMCSLKSWGLHGIQTHDPTITGKVC